MPLFYLALDQTVTNAWILYREVLSRSISLLESRMELTKELLGAGLTGPVADIDHRHLVSKTVNGFPRPCVRCSNKENKEPLIVM